MNISVSSIFSRVIVLTLCAYTLVGCSTLYLHEETCKSHAYVNVGLQDHISKRFDSSAPVRMAIIPFSVPANLAGGFGRIGYHEQLAHSLHQELLRCSDLPIVEIFNRQDWPGKSQEYYTGNFGALAQAREAGYDLVMVGVVESLLPNRGLTISSKVIDVDGGITLWYGRTVIDHYTPDFRHVANVLELTERRPDLMYIQSMTDEAVRCTVRELVGPQNLTLACHDLLEDDSLRSHAPYRARFKPE